MVPRDILNARRKKLERIKPIRVEPKRLRVREPEEIMEINRLASQKLGRNVRSLQESLLVLGVSEKGREEIYKKKAEAEFAARGGRGNKGEFVKNSIRGMKATEEKYKKLLESK